MLINSFSYSQTLECKYIPAGEPFKLDSLPVKGSSVSLSKPLEYHFNPGSNEINILSGETDSVEVCYRKIAKQSLDPVQLRSTETYDPSSYRKISNEVSVIEEHSVFEFADIESFGSITRGVTFGNRQNLFVNSALNLQMDGKLSEDLNISAVITDQNIPYQPEGNTQELRDFDNVFIKLYNKNFNLTAGDIVLQNPIEEGQFLKYYKNVQGISMDYSYSLGDRWELTSSLTGSASKGKFASTQITPIENVQGPYRLRGPNGERFIIILANSEKVYIDGKLLERGFDRDYIIDYNLAEVTFNSNMVITRFTRIRIDFEYAEQFYNRSNITATQTFESNKAKVYLNYYREGDNPDNAIGFSFDDNDLLRLSQSSGRQGVIDGYDSVGFVENQTLYQRLDTIDQDGNTQDIFVYATDADVAHWQVSFTEVGEGQGDYILSGRSANGRIFQWVSRQGGSAQGNFAPVVTVPTPNRKEMVVAGAKVSLNDYEHVFQETALSINNQNLFSDQNEYNMGYAWKGGMVSERPISAMPGYTFTGEISYEYDHRNFQAIDRFRSIEFDRDWSYDVFSDTVGRSDQIFDLQLGISKDLRNQLNYQLTTRDRSEVVNGYQQHLKFSKEFGPFQIASQNFLMGNQAGSRQAKWARTVNDFRLKLWKLSPGYSFTMDQHTLSVSDSVFSTLMHYHSHNYYLQSAESKKGKIRLDYVRRFDQLPIAGELASYTAAEEIKLSMDSRHLKNHRFSGQLNYRTVKDHTIDNEDKNLMGRFEWMSNFFQRNIRQQVTFSTANTRELRRDFIFVPVPVGEGTHTWRDENQDGVQDLNEFYEAINQDEKIYIKLFTPTDEYIQAFQTTFLHTIEAGFPARWREAKGALSELAKLSISGNIRVNFKTTASDPGERVNPFLLDLTQDSYLFARNQSRFSLFYNRNAPGPGFDVTWQNLENKALLSNGYELRNRSSWESNLRWNIDSYIFRFRGSLGETLNDADFVAGRNFQMSVRSYSPEVVWQASKRFRITGNWDRRVKREFSSESGDYSDINELGLMVTWLRQGKGSLNADFSWVDIDFQGEPNSFLGYELLEALQPGSNQRWTINWQQALGNGLQLNLQYFGRKSSESKAVHTGTAQLTAYF